MKNIRLYPVKMCNIFFHISSLGNFQISTIMVHNLYSIECEYTLTQRSFDFMQYLSTKEQKIRKENSINHINIEF